MTDGPPPVAEPVLDEEERRGLEKGIEEFNRGFFFECHDSLEEVWAGLRGPARDFFQGLIQISVGLYHLSNANRGGAVTLLRRGLGRLERYPDVYGGVNLGTLRPEVARWLDRIEAGEGFPDSLEALPKLVRSRAPTSQ